MIGILFLVIGIMTAGVCIVILAGASMYDIQAIRRSSNYRRHPYAKQWRTRPLVSIIVSAPTPECLANIKRSNYRKIEIITKPKRIARGDIILRIDDTTILHKTTVSKAVWHFTSQPTISKIECAVVTTPPATLAQLFANFRTIVLVPLQKTRTAFGVHAPSDRFVFYRKSASTHTTYFASDTAMTLASPPLFASRPYLYDTTRGRLYAIAAQIYKAVLPILVTIALFLAFVLHQQLLLYIVLIVVTIAVVLAIWWNEQLRFIQKLRYSLLVPISYWYFYAASFAPILEMFANVIKAILERRVSFLVRVKDILGII